MIEDGSNGWFYAKRYGYGAGLPRSWQGWLVLLLYLAGVMAAATLLLERSALAFVGVMILLTGLYVLVARRTTTGGWQWRFGKDRDGGTW
ncbi:hypothetical protein [Sphingomicrobium astaxanthinifaciens]|uniref:hypothetical protein n=1 Tax=Sphingomicrobium astaxanthinifaciens TaxID=1227949 RepID=UPI001FCCA8EF|nr:hypothetical protein [Sphingomicrobium astaxanthinifaciens]MCJ7421096.1 hypothetical protein [Sphingomicrobium astaxanthinifaciens]